MSLFDRLSKIDCSKYTEKKGKFSYLSWCFAVQELLKIAPEATWEFTEPTVYQDGTMMVWCNINAEGITRSAYLPVMDNRNQPIAKPNAFQVNTAQQRCLAKAISLLGLGLYIYAGEDLPEVTDYDLALQKLDADDPLAFREWIDGLGEQVTVSVYNDAPKGDKVKFKQRFDAEVRRSEEIIEQYVTSIAKAIKGEDAYELAQLGDELNGYARSLVWKRLTPEQQHSAKQLKEITG